MAQPSIKEVKNKLKLVSICRKGERQLWPNIHVYVFSCHCLVRRKWAPDNLLALLSQSESHIHVAIVAEWVSHFNPLPCSIAMATRQQGTSMHSSLTSRHWKYKTLDGLYIQTELQRTWYQLLEPYRSKSEVSRAHMCIHVCMYISSPYSNWANQLEDCIWSLKVLKLISCHSYFITDLAQLLF